ncbi:MAG: multiprotein-bridging factor 1 family protein [Pseudobdellovibrionaceae bacterium]
MNWTKETIRNLRLRYGWSQSDLARRLVCGPEVIIAWEHGLKTPEFHHSKMLDILHAHAESAADDMRASTAVEARLETGTLEQVRLSVIRDA